MLGTLVAFFIVPVLLLFVVGSAYSDAAQVIVWLIVGQAFGGMYLMVTNYIFYSKKTIYLSLVSFISGLINVGLLLFFVDAYGIKGAAYSFAIAMATRFILTWMVAQWCHPMPWLSFWKEEQNV